MKRYILAITGATGAVIGIRVLKVLLKTSDVYLLISSQAFTIIRDEIGIDWKRNSKEAIQDAVREYMKSDKINYFAEYQLDAPVSSGSFRHNGMFVAPCSMKTLAGIANGYTDNLIQRAADVTIKEGRVLVLSPRETPLSSIHLENMLKLSRMGVKIVPPVIGFYHKPDSLEDMVDFVAGKLLDSMGIEHDIYKRWSEK